MNEFMLCRTFVELLCLHEEVYVLLVFIYGMIDLKYLQV